MKQPTATFNEDGTVTIFVNGKNWVFKKVSQAVNFCNEYNIDATVIPCVGGNNNNK